MSASIRTQIDASREPLAGAMLAARERPARFAEVYRAFAPTVLRDLARLTFDVDVAAELAAETFARALERRAQFNGTTDAEVVAWLLTIARRLHTDHARRGRAQLSAVRRLGLTIPPLDDDDRAEIERLADFPVLRVRLRDALAQLPEQQRRALALRVVHELPFAEVARQLEISEPTARARVSRALRALNRLLATADSAPEMT